MRIAVVSFSFDKNKIGGAQIPALAFKKWWEILCPSDLVELVGFSDERTPQSFHDVKFHHPSAFNPVMHCYDFVFFVTPGDIITPQQFSDLDVPHAVMIHSETDINLYGYARCQSIVSNHFCRFVAVIGEGYWDGSFLSVKRLIKWHPCTLPEFLLRPSDNFSHHERAEGGKGLLYMARLSTWKGAHKLAAASYGLRRRIDYINVFGRFHDGAYRIRCMTADPRWTLIEGVYPWDVAWQRSVHRDHSYFWDVCGSEKYDIKIKRLNLAAIEAMHSGCIPVVDFATAPEWVQSFAVNFNDINKVPLVENFYEQQGKMMEAVLKSDVSYYAVMEQFHKIYTAIKESR